MSNNIENIEKNVNESTVIALYSVYDCVLKQFSAPVSLPKSKVTDYYTLLVNDVQSPYYGHESDYILNEIGVFDINTGEIELHFIERVCVLDTFIDQNRRNLQTLVKTLNYLPTGYFKMPAEQKQLIQENINKATQKYVEDYVIPDLDINKVKFDEMQSKIDDLELRLKSSNNSWDDGPVVPPFGKEGLVQSVCN